MFQMECFRCLYSEAQKDIIKRVYNILIKEEVAMVDKLISCWLELDCIDPYQIIQVFKKFDHV